MSTRQATHRHACSRIHASINKAGIDLAKLALSLALVFGLSLRTVFTISGASLLLLRVAFFSDAYPFWFFRIIVTALCIHLSMPSS